MFVEKKNQNQNESYIQVALFTLKGADSIKVVKALCHIQKGTGKKWVCVFVFVHINNKNKTRHRALIMEKDEVSMLVLYTHTDRHVFTEKT